MNKKLIDSIALYVEQHIGEFHANRIAKLQAVNLKQLLSRKNPYMFKAKNIVTAGGMVESIASATMSSAEESIFGNWMEGLAMFVAKRVYGGYKSSAEGIDLEFDKEGIHYFISVKSGPSWSNSTSMKKQKEQFRTARRVFNTSRKSVPTMCIEGCCYGNDNKGYTDSDHEKYCGEKFWTLISGEPTLFVDIIEPLGYKAKEKNEEYFIEYGRMINKFTQEFIRDYCNADGDIEWEKIVRLNAAIKSSQTSKKK
ncbi:PmeII family type II restriction endonuclease [Prevotella sp.]|uniref:PmeII family type II restriction endonuclease n=1 Tax=Prevotella sp. TaxID=59823 RepID=UPI0025E5DCD1|nr:PmeII family type II restriction endonuclease [Prevotella sp.]